MDFVSAKFPARWEIKAVIAVHIRAEIEALGLSQKEAARMCLLTQPRVSDLLSGKLGLFSADSLIDIAERLNLSFEVVCVKRQDGE